jgi:serine/threonine protein phosphatase PrpC
MPTGAGQVVLDFAALSVAGRVRAGNEDAILCRADVRLWAVADGMGGHQRGEVASAICVEVLAEAIDAGADLSSAIVAANRRIIEADVQGSAPAMGTTVVAVRFQDADFELAWVGDSRAYLIDTSGIHQLSRDHSWVQAMVDAGEMSAEQARNHPRRNVILQCLGRDDEHLEIGLLQGRLGEAQLLLLCSDGLNGELADEDIRQCCIQAKTLEALVQGLVEEANRKGGKDNISCIVVGRRQQPPVVMDQPRRFIDWLFKGRKISSGELP